MKAHPKTYDQPYSYFGQYYEYKNRYEDSVQEAEYWKQQYLQLRKDFHDVASILDDNAVMEFTVQRIKDRMFPL